jgi:hypothetical protein
MLGLLSPQQQELLVAAAIGSGESSDKAAAIAALSAKVAHLNDHRRRFISPRPVRVAALDASDIGFGRSAGTSGS